MGLNFRKSKKIGLGIKLNFSKNGVGFSSGTKGARISRSATGRKTASLGIPGSGISYRKSLSNNSSDQNMELNRLESVEERNFKPTRVPKTWVTIFIFVMSIASIGNIFDKASNLSGTDKLMDFLIGLIFMAWTFIRIKKRKSLKSELEGNVS